MIGDTALKLEQLKKRVTQLKTLSFMQKPAAVELLVEDAVFIIGQLVEEQERIEKLLDDLLVNGMGLGEAVNGE